MFDKFVPLFALQDILLQLLVSHYVNVCILLHKHKRAAKITEKEAGYA